MKTPFAREMTIAELAAMQDEDIDYSDIPEADENFWQNAKVHWPDQPKTPLNMRLDADVVAWFRAQGKGYQTRMNAVLRSFYEAHRTKPTGKAE